MADEEFEDIPNREVLGTPTAEDGILTAIVAMARAITSNRWDVYSMVEVETPPSKFPLRRTRTRTAGQSYPAGNPRRKIRRGYPLPPGTRQRRAPG